MLITTALFCIGLLLCFADTLCIIVYVFVSVQVIVCLCDAFSRPQYPSSARKSPRSSPSRKVTGANVDGAGMDAEPAGESSDIDVRFLSLPSTR